MTTAAEDLAKIRSMIVDMLPTSYTLKTDKQAKNNRAVIVAMLDLLEKMAGQIPVANQSEAIADPSGANLKEAYNLLEKTLGLLGDDLAKANIQINELKALNKKILAALRKSGDIKT